MEILLGLLVLALVFAIKLVPQQEAWIVERFGRFDKVLQPGLNFIIPLIQNVAYKHTLKEQAINIQPQKAISQDNVTLSIDGVLYVKILDAKAASYGVDDPYFAISQLAQTTMRSEIGKLPLDKTFEERESLNAAILGIINKAATSWGIECLRYEIKDIHPPSTVLQAMELQVAAERKKRAQILESEGERQSKINNAEAEKAEVVLQSEGSYTDKVNRAKGEAEAIEMVATATANSVKTVAQALKDENGKNAVSLQVAEKYIAAFEKLAKESNTVILPANLNSPSNFIAETMSIYKSLSNKK